MPQTPQQWYARISAAIEADGYRTTDLTQWSSWPWTGDLTVKALDPPADAEPPRSGAGGVDCQQCVSSRDADSGYLIWRDRLWMVGLPFEPSALPFAAFLMPRRHADLQDLTPAESARQGELLTAVEQAACAMLPIPRIQVARWGDGSEHLHWWLYARPTGQLQLRGTFLSHWDDLLPGGDAAAARADGELFAATLVELVGGELVSAK
jgi:diadenosine tetraphosphate (Ap4A) HIT family hydrolase